MSECCPLEAPEFGLDLSDEVWRQALEAQRRLAERIQAGGQPPVEEVIPAGVQALVEARQAARVRGRRVRPTMGMRGA